MAKKENEIHHSIRSISSLRNLYKFFSFGTTHSRNHGFTLIELLVVISLVGILAAGVISLINPIGQTQKAKDGQRRSDLRQIQAGLELFRSDLGRYPITAEMSGTSLSSGGTTYMQKVPKDPNGTSYYYAPTGSRYDLYACAENDKSTEVKVGSVAGLTCSKALYFQVTSP